MKHRPRVAELVWNDALREYVQDRLPGTMTQPDGELVRVLTCVGPSTDTVWRLRVLLVD